ncbi:hypothetical protein PWT90_07096 [Aphanocladium album]|nr:hypothetical protein PWT90_07096 [Aphanocladium album]
MTSDTMVRVGRGGAGNYHAAPANESVAAPPSKSLVARATQPASAPTLTGRGGAGNVVSEPNAAAHAEGKQQDLGVGENGAQMTAAEAAASVAAAQHQHRHQHGTLGGRGGAGNWHDTAAEAAEAWSAEEAEQNAQAEKKAAAEVDSGLRRPEPTHIRTRHSERR